MVFHMLGWMVAGFAIFQGIKTGPFGLRIGFILGYAMLGEGYVLLHDLCDLLSDAAVGCNFGGGEGWRPWHSHWVACGTRGGHGRGFWDEGGFQVGASSPAVWQTLSHTSLDCLGFAPMPFVLCVPRWSLFSSGSHYPISHSPCYR